MEQQNTPSTTTKVLRYDWCKLVAITKKDYKAIAKILFYIYGITKTTDAETIRKAKEYVNSEDLHKVNFLVRGVSVLNMLYTFKVDYRHIGQLLELAAYRDLYTFNVTKDNRLQKLLVLDILENLGDLSDNPLLLVSDEYIYFTCEHLR